VLDDPIFITERFPVLFVLVLMHSTAVDRLIFKATKFLTEFHQETGMDGLSERITAVDQEIRETGTYQHTEAELLHGVRMAWRNSNRCIGRLYWKSLTVRDKRNVTHPAEVGLALEEHLAWATNGGRIRPCITVFHPQRPDGSVPVRIWNKQLIRYAGYSKEEGSFIGDPAQLPFTRQCIERGWEGSGGAFDVLPWLIAGEDGVPVIHEFPRSLVLEVELSHPEYPWFEELGLRWHAVPFISDMVLEIGGILYPAAPFNGWYMSTEIGARNLGDANRYNLLPVIAARMGMDVKDRKVLWRDRALVVLTEAVLYSFDRDGVILTDHHAASEQFLKFIRNEEMEGREVKADWAWIIPPMSGSATGVFHREYDNAVVTPNFFYNHDAWEVSRPVQRCPFHVSSLE
jgi:nitric-oxide synthase, bacterial